MASKHAVIPDRELNPYCAIFPEPTEAEYRELVESIRESGQKIPIQLDAEGRILDGRTRYKACQELMLKPKLAKWEGRGSNELYATFVLAMNVKRRHLTAGQRAMVAAEIAKIGGHGGDRKSENRQLFSKKISENPNENDENQVEHGPLDPPASLEAVAKSADVSSKSIRKAAKIAEASPELAAEVAAGKKSLRQAAKEIEPEWANERDEMTDGFGNQLTRRIADIFTEAKTLADIKAKIDATRREVEAMCERSDPLAAYISLQQFVAEMKSAAAVIRFAIPYCLCPKCSGDKCNACKGQGWMSKEYYEQTTADEFKWENRQE